MKNWNGLKAALLFSLLSSCGYQWIDNAAVCPTVTVPFIPGDEFGFLTSEIIRSLSESGLVSVCTEGGEYRLEAKMVAKQSEKIGFRIDPQKVDRKVRKNLLATEGRRAIALETQLYRGKELVWGPCEISADAEYDFVDGDSLQDLTFVNPKGEVVQVLPFSLGQLESVESAELAAEGPLYRRLAQKVVDAVFRQRIEEMQGGMQSES